MSSRLAACDTVHAIRRLLLTIVLLALVTRFWGLGFGLPYAYARPDETVIAGAAIGFLSGDLTPPYFMYPSLFMYAAALLYAAYYLVSRPLNGYATLAAFAESRHQSLEPFFYLTRGLSAVMGTLTVWSVYALGRRVFDETVGIVASLFLALALLHVRDSHFGVTDVTMASFVVLSVLGLIRWQQSGAWHHAALAGLAGGLATSTKYNGLGVCVPFAVAIAQGFVGRAFRAALRSLAGATLVFGASFTVAFLAASPFIVIEWHRFLNDVSNQGTGFMIGQGMPMVSRGWTQHARVSLPAALGWPIYLAGVAGTVGLLAMRFRQSAVLLAFPLAYYVVAGSGYTVFARYMIPELPFLCISAAWLAVTAVRALLRATSPLVRHAPLHVVRASATYLPHLALAAVALVMVAPSARQVFRLDQVLARTDNRVIVARALARLIPPGSSVYHSGGAYGHVPYDLPGGELAVIACSYDEQTGEFAPGGRLPDWVIVQRSPLLLYSYVPAALERIVRESYDLVASFRTLTSGVDRVYDQQDAFFLPEYGLEGIRRPGPEFEIYRRRR